MKKKVYVYLTDPRYADESIGYYVDGSDFAGKPPEGWVLAHQSEVEFTEISQSKAAEQCMKQLAKEIEKQEAKIEVLRTEMRKYEALTYEQ